MIRIVLLDDHALVREGVSRLLEAQAEMSVVGSYGDARICIKKCSIDKPDVAIVDIAMPNDNGIEVTRQLRRSSPDTNILVLSMHSNPEYVHQALLAGALGYVLKESAGQVLVDAVRAVNLGRRYISNELSKDILRRYEEEGGMPDPIDLLSAREQQVLRLTVDGLTIADTAQRLGISPKSVETYRSRLMSKLGIEGVPALVKFAIRRGIIGVE
jgi:DNA-binding NarL/FixJ family response regulator